MVHSLEVKNTMEQNNIELLKLMKLPVMADEYESQSKNIRYQEMSFDERLSILLNKEYDSRILHTIQKNIKQARFSISNADFNDLNKSSDRKLPIDLIEALKSNDYIKNGLSVIIIGAAGVGKTWLSCAYGSLACKERFKTKYIRLPELLSDLEAARIKNNYRQTILKYGKIDLLIIDDFLLNSANTIEANDVLEILEIRANKKSTIFASQFSPEGWHERLGGGPVADAILDRITNSSYTIFLQGKSLRETYSRVKR